MSLSHAAGGANAARPRDAQQPTEPGVVPAYGSGSAHSSRCAGQRRSDLSVTGTMSGVLIPHLGNCTGRQFPHAYPSRLHRSARGEPGRTRRDHDELCARWRRRPVSAENPGSVPRAHRQVHRPGQAGQQRRRDAGVGPHTAAGSTTSSHGQGEIGQAARGRSAVGELLRLADIRPLREHVGRNQRNP